MEWKWYEDGKAFAQIARPLLEKREDVYSLFLGVLGQIEQGRYENFVIGLAAAENEVQVLALMTPPHPLQIIILGEKEGAAIVARQFHGAGLQVPGVIGDKMDAGEFADHWCLQTGKKARVAMDQGLYRLDAVQKKLGKAIGGWRVANRLDAPLIADWYRLFSEETGIGTPLPEEAEEKVGEFIALKEVYLWEVEGRAVACMKKARPSKHGITVSFVYTPKELRGRGYARSLVAEVSEELLGEYDFVMLYTDLSNKTANNLYQGIGYEQIANPVHLKFH